MDPNSQQIRRALSAIDEVLWLDWDPIGINEIPEARDEYSSYVPGILGLIQAGAADAAIVEHLSRIEAERMGLSQRPLQQLQRVVDALRRVVGL